MAASVAVATVATGFIAAKGQRQEGKYQKAIMEQNARISEMQADDAIERGKFDEHAHRLSVRQLIGAQKASFGAQGIEIDAEESTGAVLLSTTAQGELDALTIRNNAAREAWGYRVQAQNYTAQGQLMEASAKNAARDTILTSFVSGVGAFRRGGGTLPSFGRGTRVPTGGRMQVHSPSTYGIV